MEFQYVLIPVYCVFHVINSFKSSCIWPLTEISEQKFVWWVVPSRCIRDDNVPVHCGHLPPTICFTGKIWLDSPGISFPGFIMLGGTLWGLSIAGDLAKKQKSSCIWFNHLQGLYRWITRLQQHNYFIISPPGSVFVCPIGLTICSMFTSFHCLYSIRSSHVVHPCAKVMALFFRTWISMT